MSIFTSPEPRGRPKARTYPWGERRPADSPRTYHPHNIDHDEYVKEAVMDPVGPHNIRSTKEEAYGSRLVEGFHELEQDQ